MQCVNCHFENMPGLQACCRCGTSLGLATAAIEVHPPRAGRWAKIRRKMFPSVRRWRYGLSNWRQSLVGGLDENLPEADFVWRMAIPGWPQNFGGRPIFGRLLMGTWLGCLVFGFVLYGSPVWQVLLGVALTCHLMTIIDVVWTATPELRDRLTQLLQYSFVVGFCLYGSGFWLLSRSVIAQQFNYPALPFQIGDVVLCRPLGGSPAAGDVVLYDIPPHHLNRPGMIIRVEGGRIDRVLGVGGDHVVWRNQSLMLNDKPSPWRPLNPGNVAAPFDITVPENSVLIVPSTSEFGLRWGVNGGDVRNIRGVTNLDFQNLCVVATSRVQAKLFWQTWPLSRFGRPSTWSE